MVASLSPLAQFEAFYSNLVSPPVVDNAEFVEHFVIFNNALLTSFETNQRAAKRHPLPSDQAMAIADSFTISIVDGVEVERRRENKGPVEEAPPVEKPKPPPKPKKPKPLATFVDPFTAYSLGIDQNEVMTPARSKKSKSEPTLSKSKENSKTVSKSNQQRSGKDLRSSKGSSKSPSTKSQGISRYFEASISKSSRKRMDQDSAEKGRGKDRTSDDANDPNTAPMELPEPTTEPTTTTIATTTAIPDLASIPSAPSIEAQMAAIAAAHSMAEESHTTTASENFLFENLSIVDITDITALVEQEAQEPRTAENPETRSTAEIDDVSSTVTEEPPTAIVVEPEVTTAAQDQPVEELQPATTAVVQEAVQSEEIVAEKQPILPLPSPEPILSPIDAPILLERYDNPHAAISVAPSNDVNLAGHDTDHLRPTSGPIKQDMITVSPKKKAMRFSFMSDKSKSSSSSGSKGSSHSSFFSSFRRNVGSRSSRATEGQFSSANTISIPDKPDEMHFNGIMPESIANEEVLAFKENSPAKRKTPLKGIPLQNFNKLRRSSKGTGDSTGEIEFENGLLDTTGVEKKETNFLFIIHKITMVVSPKSSLMSKNCVLTLSHPEFCMQTPKTKVRDAATLWPELYWVLPLMTTSEDVGKSRELVLDCTIADSGKFSLPMDQITFPFTLDLYKNRGQREFKEGNIQVEYEVKFIERKPHIFGMPIGDLMKIQMEKYPDATVPLIVSKCFDFLIPKYLDEEGLFRLSCNKEALRFIRTSICLHGYDLIDQHFGEHDDPHLIANLLKNYFRELPVSLITKNVQVGLLRLLEETDLENQLLIAQHELSKLDTHSFALLETLCDNLHLLSCYSDSNNMSAFNLSIVWTPNIFWKCAPDASRNKSAEEYDVYKIKPIVEFLVANKPAVFNDRMKSFLPIVGEVAYLSPRFPSLDRFPLSPRSKALHLSSPRKSSSANAVAEGPERAELKKSKLSPGKKPSSNLDGAMKERSKVFHQLEKKMKKLGNSSAHENAEPLPVQEEPILPISTLMSSENPDSIASKHAVSDVFEADTEFPLVPGGNVFYSVTTYYYGVVVRHSTTERSYQLDSVTTMYYIGNAVFHPNLHLQLEEMEKKPASTPPPVIVLDQPKPDLHLPLHLLNYDTSSEEGKHNHASSAAREQFTTTGTSTTTLNLSSVMELTQEATTTAISTAPSQPALQGEGELQSARVNEAVIQSHVATVVSSQVSTKPKSKSFGHHAKSSRSHRRVREGKEEGKEKKKKKKHRENDEKEKEKKGKKKKKSRKGHAQSAPQVRTAMPSS